MKHRIATVLFVVLCISIVLCSCSTKPYVVSKTSITRQKGQDIYVVNHGWHTGFLLPASDLNNELPEIAARFNTAQWLEIGWGDRGFYQAPEITTGLTIQAIFWPTQSVLHIVAVTREPTKYFSGSDLEIIHLKPRQYALLLEFISSSFFKDKSGKTVALTHGIYGDSQFYKAVGKYFLFNTCNKWTAKGLQSAGVEINSATIFTAGSVMKKIKKRNSRKRSIRQTLPASRPRPL